MMYETVTARAHSEIPRKKTTRKGWREIVWRLEVWLAMKSSNRMRSGPSAIECLGMWCCARVQGKLLGLWVSGKKEREGVLQGAVGVGRWAAVS